MEEKGDTALRDEAQLGKPINIGVGVSGIQQVIRYIQKGTAEVRDLLLNECELLYECRFCRNMFRSLANFVIHKRDFCKHHFCENMVLFTTEESPEEVVVVHPESPKSSDDNLEENIQMEVNQNEKDGLEEESENIEPTLEVSTPKIYQPPVKPNKVYPVISQNLDWREKEKTNTKHNNTVAFYTKCIKHLEQRTSANSSSSKSVITLHPIRSNPNAVYQTINNANKPASKTERVDYYTPANETQKTTVETVKKADTPEKKQGQSEKISSRQRHDSDGLTIVERLKELKECDVKELKCLKCKSQYTSIKTLDFHMRTIHSNNRIYYPCLFCSTSFVQLWGVTRHMITIHKKTKEQVNRLREAVKRKAFYRHNETTSSTKNGVKVKLGSTIRTKSFRRNHAISENKSAKALGKKSSQYHACGKCKRMFDRRSSQITHEKFCVNNVLSSSQPKVVLKDAGSSLPSHLLLSNQVKPKSLDKSNAAEYNSGRPKRNAKKKAEVDFVDISAIGYSRVVNKSENPQKKRTSALLEKKVLAIVNTKKNQCLKCNRRFSTFSNLRRHAAIHIGWNRFKCKYCDYQSYNRSDCRTHMQRVHLQGKPSADQIDKLVLDLPSKQIQAKKEGSQKPAPVKKSSPQSENESPPQPSPPQLRTAAKSLSNSSASTTSSKSSEGNNKALNASNSQNKNVKPSSSTTNVSSNSSSGVKVRNPTAQPVKATRLSVRRAGTPPINSNDNFLTLVTRSGSYPKADLFTKYFQSRKLEVKKKSEHSSLSSDSGNSIELDDETSPTASSASAQTSVPKSSVRNELTKSSKTNGDIEECSTTETTDNCDDLEKEIVLFSDDSDREN